MSSTPEEKPSTTLSETPLLDTSRTKEEQEAINVHLVRRLSRQHVLKGVVSKQATDAVEKSDEKKGGKTKLPGWKHFVAGAVAGACEVAGTMPLDVVKTQMQINPGKYKNPLNAMAGIHKSNGIRGLYYGMPAFMLQTSGKAAIRFTAFNKIKDLLNSILGQETVDANPIAANLVCGLAAGAAEAAIWTTPTERLKVLRQSQIGSSVGSQSVGGLIRTGGISSLFVGLVPCVIRQASSVGIRFMLYDPVKKVISFANGGKEGGTLTYMAAGGTVGAISVAINNPVDVVKNIKQSGKGEGLGTVGVMQKVIKADGWKGLFRGLSARVPRVFCGQAITFAAYEQMAKVLLKI